MMRTLALAIALGIALAGGPAFAETPLFKSTAEGNPQVKAIDTISFGPHGLLLIGDGRGGQVIAVDTGDVTPKPALKSTIDKIDEKLAGRIGTTAKGIAILDLAVNPASGLAYVAIRKQDDKSPLLLTVDGDGKIGEFALDKVKYARLKLPTAKAPITVVSDVAWAGDRVLVAAAASEEFACKLYTISAPLTNDAVGQGASAETYHVAHGRWETKAPMSTLLPIEEDGKKYLVGAFACTPLVKYPLDDIKPDAKVKGTSVVELGSGNRPLNMFTYEKDGKSYVLMNTFRFHHKKQPFGPSPYWTVRVERDLLGEATNVNENATLRLDKKGQPATERIKLIPEFHGVVHLDKLNAKQALVMREDGDGGLALAALPLP
jgi:hypothetical protein